MASLFSCRRHHRVLTNCCLLAVTTSLVVAVLKLLTFTSMSVNMFRFTAKHGDERQINTVSELSALIQSQLHKLQNPANCSSARLLLCRVNKLCGLGCQFQQLVQCLVAATATRRAALVRFNADSYLDRSWNKFFRPISESCGEYAPDTVEVVSWPGSSDSIRVLEFLTFDRRPSNRVPDSFHPMSIDLIPSIERFHQRPYTWLSGQFKAFLFRLQPAFQGELEDMENTIDFKHPIIGLHIRRTDKQQEAAYHDVSEYMERAAEQFALFEQQRPPNGTDQRIPDNRRRVYLATDEPAVWDEMISRYGVSYEILGSAVSARLGGTDRRETDEGLRATITDIYFLSRVDHLVCTLSSNICRLAYELMQTRHVDASRRVTSLDGRNFF